MAKMGKAANRDLDYILETMVGGGGAWQWRKALWLVPQYAANGIPLMLHMFTAYSPRHRCFVDACDNANASNIDASFVSFAIPKDRASSNFLKESESFDPCYMYAVAPDSKSVCAATSFIDLATTSCSRYVYDRSEFVETLSTKLDLVCDRADLNHLLGSVMMLGLTLGSLIGGPLGDRIGRKNAMFLGMVIGVPCLIAGGFAESYALYAFLRLISCTVIVFGWIASHNFQIEFFSRSHRRAAFALGGLISHVAGFLLPTIVYFNRHWTYMHVWCGVAAAAALPTYFVIPESARWLASNNQWEKATDIIMDIGRGNKRPVTDKQKDEIVKILRGISEEAALAHETKLNICDLFGRSFRAKTLILMLCWCSSIVTYYALALNAHALAGDIFVNFGVALLVDIPAHLTVFLIADRLGRQKSLLLMLLGLGFACVTLAFIPKSNSGAVLAVYIAGKFCASGAASFCWLFTSELFPTNLRSQAMGTCSMVSRIFGMTSSFVAELSTLWTPLPLLVLAVPSFIGASLALRLPETTGKSLPATFEEAVALDAPSGSAIPELVFEEGDSSSDEMVVSERERLLSDSE